MSDEEAPETVDKSIRAYIGAVAFTLVLVGGEMIAEKDGSRFTLGVILTVLALPAYLSAAWWRLLKEKLDRRAIIALATMEAQTRWWVRSIFIVAIALVLSRFIPFIPGLNFAESWFRDGGNLPEGSSRLDIWNIEEGKDDRGHISANFHLVNNGKTVARELLHLGAMEIATKAPSPETIVGMFAMLKAQMALQTTNDLEIQPGQNTIWFTIEGPPVDDVILAPVDSGNAFPYVIGLIRYRDSTLPSRKAIYREVCMYWIKRVAHLCESGHNKTYVAEY